MKTKGVKTKVHTTAEMINNKDLYEKDNERIMGRCSKIAVDIGRQPH